MTDELTKIEERFKVLCRIGGDLSKFPLSELDDVEFDTDKDKSREFAEVFTPLYIVDRMVNLIPSMTQNKTVHDLCSGYGQFSIRVLRRLYQRHSINFKIKKYLKDQLYFSELQLSSCFKLLWIFSTDINLYIGNALRLGKLPPNAKGIWYLMEKADEWVNVTKLVKHVYGKVMGTKKNPKGKLFAYPEIKEKKFVEEINEIMGKAAEGSEEHIKLLKQILRTKEGRQLMLNFLSKEASNVEQNWQSHTTPEKIIRDMVNIVPSIETLKRVLVLFNYEFVECLVVEKGIDPKNIDFGFDSDLEGKAVRTIYGVNVFSIDHCLEVYKRATLEASGKRQGYEIIFSNPPYHIDDGGHGASARPIYHEIVMYAIDELRPHYLCMITPSKWMAGGKGLDSYRARMLADRHLRLIEDFTGEHDVFQSVTNKGGVSYFLWDREYDGLCELNRVTRNLNEFDVLVRDNASCHILRKILAKTSKFCNTLVLPRKPFGLSTNFKNWVSQNHIDAVRCISVGKVFNWVGPNQYTDPHNILPLYKAIVSKATMEGASFSQEQRQLLMGFNVLSPYEICTETYIVAGTFKTKKEAENYIAYMKTRFYRFMLSLRTITQDVNSNKFSWVPDLGDYRHPYTDDHLQIHFGLTTKDVEHINKIIKEIK